MKNFALTTATKHENHANQQGNGRMTVDFFKEEFGFTGRETVAIMGAHTLGRMNSNNSGHNGPWIPTVEERQTFSNKYYSIMIDSNNIFTGRVISFLFYYFKKLSKISNKIYISSFTYITSECW